MVFKHTKDKTQSTFKGLTRGDRLLFRDGSNKGNNTETFVL